MPQAPKAPNEILVNVKQREYLALLKLAAKASYLESTVPALQPEIDAIRRVWGER